MTLKVKNTVSMEIGVQPRVLNGKTVVSFCVEEQFEIAELFAAAAIWLKQHSEQYTVVGISFAYLDIGNTKMTELLLTVE